MEGNFFFQIGTAWLLKFFLAAMKLVFGCIRLMDSRFYLVGASHLGLMERTTGKLYPLNVGAIFHCFGERFDLQELIRCTVLLKFSNDLGRHQDDSAKRIHHRKNDPRTFPFVCVANASDQSGLFYDPPIRSEHCERLIFTLHGECVCVASKPMISRIKVKRYKY